MNLRLHYHPSNSGNRDDIVLNVSYILLLTRMYVDSMFTGQDWDDLEFELL